MIVSLSMASAVLWTAYAAYSGLGQDAKVERALGLPFTVWLASLGLSACLQTWAMVKAWRNRSGGWPAVRWGFSWAVVFWLGYVWLAQPLDLFQLESSIAVAGGLYGLGFALSQRLETLANRRWVQRAQLTLFNISLTAVLLELSLAAASSVAPFPVLMGKDSYVEGRLSGYAFPKGYIHRGFPCNEAGHYDHAFLPSAARNKPTVLMIGDSFSASLVPHRYHFTTVSEQALGDVEIYNMGVSGIGPEEYLYLLSHEGLPLEPDAVIVNLFIGNDLSNTRTGTGVSQSLKRWFDPGNVRIWFLPQRLMLIAAERKRAEADVFGKDPQQILTTKAEIQAAYPWVLDHRLEKPALSEDRYLEIAGWQIESSCPPHEERLRPLLEHLATMKRLCRDIPFAVMLIPAEYQVEDALWEAATTRLTKGPYVKDAAQTQIRRWLEDAGIPCLDLLPALRAAKPFEDGNRHCYAARDTHFNTRGNQITAEQLTPFVRDLLR